MTFSFDKSLLLPCPTLRPLVEEFADPIGYFGRDDVAELGRIHGLLKVIPPDLWRPPLSVSPQFRFHARQQRLADLGLLNRARRLFVENANRYLRMNSQYRGRPRRLKDSFSAEGKPIYYYDLYLRHVQASESEPKSDLWKNINRLFGITPDSRTIRKEFALSIQDYTQYLSTYQFQSNPFLREQESEEQLGDEIIVVSDTDSEQDSDEACKACGTSVGDDHVECNECEDVFHLGCAQPAAHSAQIHKWYCQKCLVGSGEYGFEEDVNVKYTLEEFEGLSNRFAREYAKANGKSLPLLVDWIEKMFWETVERGELDVEVKYGADIPGAHAGFSAIPESSPYSQHPFSLCNLPSARGSLLNYVDSSISGMQLPWVYVGSLLLTFCWHVEDHYTLLANYCHKGATKKWYGISSENADKFESMVRLLAPDMFERQPDLLHQLVTLVLPMTLAAHGIPCTYGDQNEGEYIVTYPRVYHAGFNCGFNINEAVNFAIPQWLLFGEQALSHYQPIGKENVFSHYRMVQAILENRREANRTLIKECVASMRGYISSVQHKMARIDKFHTVDRMVGKAGEERLCKGCKTSLAHFYCRLAPPTTQPQLFTPQSSPQNVLSLGKSPLVCEMDAFSALIESAKQTTQEPSAKRRRLRLAAPTSLPELKPSPSFAPPVSKSVRTATPMYTCLDCCDRYFKDTPLRITIICESSITLLCHSVDMRLHLA